MAAENTSKAELARIFLRLGATAFGGPAAHIAVMHDEFVKRRKWLTSEEFLDLLGAANMIPGPNSTEMAIHIGQTRGGIPGLIVAGTCFILPAAVMVTVIAWVYVSLGVLPQVDGVLYAIKPVVIAIILHAILQLARTALKSRALAVLGLAAAAANVMGVGEITVLFASGLVSFAAHPRKSGRAAAFILFPLALAPALPSASLSYVFLYFLKIGSVLFGSGYLLVAFLQADLVERLGWITGQQLLDAIAVGQLTPGPLFTAATFVGYLVWGPAGAVVATFGIFLPAFFFVAVTHTFVRRMRQIKWAQAVLDGINVAAVALMLVVAWHLGRAAIVDWTTAGLAVISALILARFRPNSAWLILGAAVFGLGASASGFLR